MMIPYYMIAHLIKCTIVCDYMFISDELKVCLSLMGYTHIGPCTGYDHEIKS